MTYTTSAPFAATDAQRFNSYARAAELDRMEWMARSLDSAFRVPVLGVRLGWDSIVGWVPGVGDTIMLAPGIYLLVRAARMGASRGVLARMAANTGLDWAIGTIPFLGDIFDIGFKSNLRNVKLLRQHLDIPQGQ